ncbi:MAG: S8 family serine peptidase, partial [bacterium]|nr:S8 family serine peptidase [bacterium]
MIDYFPCIIICMLRPSLATKTAIGTVTTVAAAAMLAVSSLALSVGWGMMMVAVGRSLGHRQPNVLLVSPTPGTIVVESGFSPAPSGRAGYFIVYDGEPLVRIEQAQQQRVIKRLSTARAAEKELADIKVEREKQRTSVRGKVLDKIAVSRKRANRAQLEKEVFTKKFDDLIFADVVRISEDEAVEVAKILGVQVVPNYLSHALVTKSAALIGADQVRAFDANGDQCAVSGKPCLDGSGITVAILDTGVDYTQPMFGSCTRELFLNHQCAKVADGYDFVTCDALTTLNGCCYAFDGRGNCVDDRSRPTDSDPMDGEGHGSHVAGIAAGRDVESNVFGVASGATILAYKVANDAQGIALHDWIISALTESVQKGARVVNLSFGHKWIGAPDDALTAAINAAVDAGVVVVVSAGNSGPGGEASCRQSGDGSRNSVCSPGTAEKAITVGAVYKQSYAIQGFIVRIGPDIDPQAGQVASFSSRGPVEWSPGGILQTRNKPDVTAPGIFICSSGTFNVRGPCLFIDEQTPDVPTAPNESYVRSQGTSQAAPMVTGAAALVLQKNPTLTPDAVKNVLLATAADDPAVSPASEGAGRVNVVAAIQATQSPAVPAPRFRRGDADSNSRVELTDAVFTLEYLFIAGKPAPGCLDAADANDTGEVDLSDPIRTLYYLFIDGAAEPLLSPGATDL